MSIETKINDFIVIDRGEDGLPNIIYIYDSIARFENYSIYKIAKYVFRNNITALAAIFPNSEFLDSIPFLIPKKTFHIRDSKTNELETLSPEYIKRVLINLFNSFRTFDDSLNISYYLPLRKNIHNVIS
ncbi:virion core protein [Pteropox virus]|uniref:Virion core protein n=1 Tax=Pteropox virus TaxID=1873698 RepID=A0A1B1MRG0_9POXV|nr:virion core protein [Pteropox virus]ANS71167.1 virion core protein [Pteropox virus]